MNNSGYLRAKLGDFVFLHCRNFDTWGTISKVPNLELDPFADVFEIIDHRGRVTWTRSNAIKFLYPATSSAVSISQIKAQLDLSWESREKIKNWAFSLPAERTFHLEMALNVLGRDWNTLERSFSLFRYLYIFSTDWLQKDPTFRINGPFAVRNAKERRLIEQISTVGNCFSSSNSQLEGDEIAIRKFAYCSFENTMNSPFGKLPILKGKSQSDAHEMLVKSNSVPELLNIPLEQCTLELEMPQQHEKLSLSSTRCIEKRKPFRVEIEHFPQALAIDGERASEIDDALSVSLPGPRFHVHVADCSSFIPPESPLDRIAKQRTTSVYLPERTFPMLPWSVTKSLSLTSNRHCITFSFELDPEGAIVNPSISPSVVEKIVQKTYSECESELDDKSIDDNSSVDNSETFNHKTSSNPSESCIYDKLHNHNTSTTTTLKHLWVAAQKLSKNATNRLRIQLPNPHIWVSAPLGGGANEKLAFQFDHSPAPKSHMLVAELMIAAGRVASQFCHANQIPIPFRSQEKCELWNDQPMIMEAFKSPDSGLLDAYFYAKSAYAAKFTSHPQEHISMGLDCYAKVTSPIRRVADQIVHQQLFAYWQGKRLPYDTKNLDPLLDWINERESRTKLLQRQSLRFWTLVYWKESLGKRHIFDGTVVGYLELYRTFQIFVHKWNVVVPYRLDYGPGGKVLGLDVGMRVRFVLLENEPIRGIIRLEIIDRPDFK